MAQSKSKSGTESPCPQSPGRRSALKACLGIGLGFAFIDLAGAQTDNPKNLRPQEGDLIVFAAGDRKGQPVTPADLPVGGPSLLAFAMDPKSKLVRDGSRLNKIVLVRVDPQQLSENARELSAEGVVAYSAICTHTGCDVSGWKADKAVLLCSCHYSEFDPKSDARVVAGPAPRPLAALPLKVADGVLVAAGGFIGRVGFQKA